MADASPLVGEPVQVRRLREQFPDAVLDVVEFRGEVTVRVPTEQIKEICFFMRDDPATRMDLLRDQTAVDWLPRQPRFDVIYLIYSIPLRMGMRLKAATRADDSIDSVTDVWAAANWAERECYDMFGVRFVGHPDLRRILLPEYWDEGYPLRKDYPLRGFQQNKWDYEPERTTR